MDGPEIVLIHGTREAKCVLQFNLAGLQLLQGLLQDVAVEHSNRQLVYSVEEKSVILSPAARLGNGASLHVELLPDKAAPAVEVEKAPAGEPVLPPKPALPPKKPTYRLVDGHIEVDGDANTYEVAEVGIDGDCGYALLGPNLQEGEAEFVQIPEPNHVDDRRAQKMWACQEAMWRLRKRLELPNLTYHMSSSHPNYR